MSIEAAIARLAKSTHYKNEINDILEFLPSEIKNSYLNNDAHQLRVKISSANYFSDSKVVVQE